MSGDTTWPVPEIAVRGQSDIMIRLAPGEVELSQHDDGDYNAIYVRPENALTGIVRQT